MAERLAYAGGALVAESPRVRDLERRVLATAAGVFETVLVVDGVPRDPDAHLDRLRQGALRRGLRLPAEDELCAALAAVAAAAPQPAARLRVLVSTPEFEVLITAVPYELPVDHLTGGVSVGLLARPRVRRDDSCRQCKTLEWRRRGQDLLAGTGRYDVLLVNDAGRIAEGVRSNVIVQRGDDLVTPALSEGCLPGTVRRRLLEAGVVREGRLRVEEVVAGHEMALTNSLVGVAAVRRIAAVDCVPCAFAPDLRASLETGS